ncbi:MAG: bacteriohemerythrin [Pseudomonadota bacterium]|nr:MAG: hypothetical protein DIU56_16855 [Pseudomonadota bacterium]
MSDFFQWDPAKLSLHVPEMDNEHQVLISKMNKVHSLHASGASHANIALALDDLVRYTSKHFADEEAYMERIGFPGLRVHKGVHRQLMDRLADYQRTFQTTRKLPDDLFVFFKMWLSAHICGIDAKYALHAQQAKAG